MHDPRDGGTIQVGTFLASRAANDEAPGPADMTLSLTRMATITVPPGQETATDWRSLPPGWLFQVRVDGETARFEILEVAWAPDGSTVIRAAEVPETD